MISIGIYNMKSVASQDRSTVSSTFTYIEEASHPNSNINMLSDQVLIENPHLIHIHRGGQRRKVERRPSMIKVHLILISLTKGITNKGLL